MSGKSSRLGTALRVLAVAGGLIMLGVASGSGGQAATGYRIPLPSPVPLGGTPLDEFTDFANAAFRGTLINRWQVPLGSDPWSEPDDTGTPWSSGGGMWEIKTRFGPGFRFVVTDEMRVASGGKKARIADIDHFVDQQNYLGTIFDLSGKFMFPAAGNPDGFPPYPGWNVLWEFSTEEGYVANGFGIDALKNRLYVDTYDAATNGRRRALSPGKLRYDRWFDFRWQIRWSRGSDGFVNFWFDGRQIAAFRGPNLSQASEPPFMEGLGFYSGTQTKRNETRWAALTIR